MSTGAFGGDSGGSPETVEPGVTGYVVATDDHIVEGLRSILADPERAVQMGLAGRERVLARFTWPAVAGRLVEGVTGMRETWSGT